MPDMIWVTNTGKNGLKGHYPRRKGRYVEGDPKGSEMFSSATLKHNGIVGLYLDEEDVTLAELRKRPMVTYGDKEITR